MRREGLITFCESHQFLDATISLLNTFVDVAKLGWQLLQNVEGYHKGACSVLYVMWIAGRVLI